MKQIPISFCAALLSVCAANILRAQTPAAPAPPFLLSSPDFADGTRLPIQFSCAASTPPPSGPRNISLGVSPTLKWTTPPAGTRSYILILHDGDSRTPHGLTDTTHWLVFNIPGESRELAGRVPPDGPLPNGGSQGKNMMGRSAYQGPCANPGPPHHYIYELLALDQKLDLPAGATRDEIEKAAQGHVLRGAVTIALFSRPAAQYSTT